MKKIYTLLIIFTLTFVSFFCKFSVKATNDSSNLTNPSTDLEPHGLVIILVIYLIKMKKTIKIK